MYVMRVLVGDNWVPVPAIRGVDGRGIHIEVQDDILRYRYDGEDTWQDIFDFSSVKTVKGDPGVGIISVEQITSAVGSGGKNVIEFTLSDGTKYQIVIQNGLQGEPGETGYTPQRGTDYWTEDDVSAIHAYVDDHFANGEW